MTAKSPASPDDESTGRGVLFVVVGPSGVGKDTLIEGARLRLTRAAGSPTGSSQPVDAATFVGPRTPKRGAGVQAGTGTGAPADHSAQPTSPDCAFVFARRVITRPCDAGGEDHEEMDPAAFAAAKAAGAFLFTWHAHGLDYAIRRDVLAALQAGRNVLMNGSRGQIRAYAQCWPQTVVLAVSAPVAVIAARLAARGREDAEAVAARLARAVPISGAGQVVDIVNDGDVDAGVAQLVRATLAAAHLPLRVCPLAPWPERNVAWLPEGALAAEALGLQEQEPVQIVSPNGRTRVRLVLCADDTPLRCGEIGMSPEAMAAFGFAAGRTVTLHTEPDGRIILAG